MSIADPHNHQFWSPDRLVNMARPLLSRKILDRLALAFFVVFLIAIALVGLKKPEYNWDMAPYIAASIHPDGPLDEAGIKDLHKKAWGMIEDRAPQTQIYNLRAGSPYNLHLYQHPEAFYSMLPMYEVKLLYISTIRWLGKITGPVNATILISVLSAMAFGLICLMWMQRGGFIQSAPLVVSLLLLSGFFYMPRIATPDLMFASLCLGGIYLLLRNHELTALPLLYAAFLVRPDNIIFLFALCLAAIGFGQKKLGLFALFAAALASYFWITSGSNHPGWWAHFYFSNVEIQNTMVGFHPDFSVMQYFRGLMRGIMVSMQTNNWLKLMLVLLFGWGLLVRSGKAPDMRASAMLVAIILCFGGKFVTFPLPDDRTYFVYVIAFAMILLEAWKPRLDMAAKA